MRDRDRRDTTELADSRHCRVVDERDAVPEKTLYEERALSDRERRFSSDPVEIRLDFLEPVAVVACELGHRRPALTFVSDVLALVETDGTAVGLIFGGWEFRAARDADERLHSEFLRRPGSTLKAACQRIESGDELPLRRRCVCAHRRAELQVGVQGKRTEIGPDGREAVTVVAIGFDRLL